MLFPSTEFLGELLEASLDFQRKDMYYYRDYEYDIKQLEISKHNYNPKLPNENIPFFVFF